MRDLLVALGHERATFVGHSLGGGVAMQLAYQFPERCERLVLVDSGGLGREVNLLLRAATLPGAEFVLPLLASQRVLERRPRRSARCSAASACAPAPTSPRWRAATPRSADRDARAAFVHTLRTIVDPGGQRVNASDRLYLAEEVAVPDRLGRARQRSSRSPTRTRAHELVPSSRLEIFEDAGHFPHVDEPTRFIEVLTEFIDTTEPAARRAGRWRELLRVGRRAA